MKYWQAFLSFRFSPLSNITFYKRRNLRVKYTILKKGWKNKIVKRVQIIYIHIKCVESQVLFSS